MTPPKPVTAAVTVAPQQSASTAYPVFNIWELKANPGAVQAGADAWRRLAGTLRDQANTIDDEAKPLHDGEWRGDTEETFHDHRLKLTRDIRETATAASQAADALKAAATSLTEKQAELHAAFKASAPLLSGASPWGDYLIVTLWGSSADQDTSKKIVDDAIAKAKGIRSQLEEQLETNRSALSKVSSTFGIVAGTWIPGRSASTTFDLPPAADGPRSIVDYGPENDHFIVSAGGASADEVEEKEDPDTGQRIIVVHNNVYDDTTGELIEDRKTEFRVPEGMVPLIQDTNEDRAKAER